MQSLATGYGLIEGPVWDPAKGLYFSDVMGGRRSIASQQHGLCDTEPAELRECFHSICPQGITHDECPGKLSLHTYVDRELPSFQGRAFKACRIFLDERRLSHHHPPGSDIGSHAIGGVFAGVRRRQQR